MSLTARLDDDDARQLGCCAYCHRIAAAADHNPITQTGPSTEIATPAEALTTGDETSHG